MEAPYLLSDVRLQAEDGTAMAIGVAGLGVSPRDNAVNLSASEGAMSNLVLHCLLHLSASLILIPLQLSCHVDWDEEDEDWVQVIHSLSHFVPSS